VEAPRRRHRARRVLILALVALLGAGAVAFVLYRRSGTHPVPTDVARRRFAQSSSTQPANPALLQPPAGVYTYRGSGTEHLSLPPKSQSQGPTMPGTVTHDGSGCWTFRIDYSNHHWQTWHYCARSGGLVEQGGQSWARWDFVVTTYDNLADFTCDPPSVVIRADMGPGDEWQQRCEGTSSGTKGRGVSAGPYTYVGRQTIEVGGDPVATYHFRQRRTLSGNQSGTQDSDLWFARHNGLPVRNERSFTVHTDTPIGASTYTERGTFVLTSLEPQQ
jgi:hypothetical protein